MTKDDSSDITYIHLHETESTSNYLSVLASQHKVDEGTVVYADFQTAGKGQRGNRWESEAGANLLFSIILYPFFLAVRKQFLLSQIVALAVKEELDVISDGFSIKWPNDIYWHEKKICGILIENDIQGSHITKSIAGIGINTNQTMFSNFAPNPVSLRQITGETYHTHSLLKRIAGRIIHYYKRLQEGEEKSIRKSYHEAMFRKEGFHRYRDRSGEFTARIVSVRPEGMLLLEDENGKRKEFLFKEVQFIL